MSPQIGKFIFGGIIDAKVVSRKILNIWSNLIVSIMLFSIGFGFADSAESIVAAMFVANLSHQIVDGTLISYQLEQARNVPNGNEDM